MKIDKCIELIKSKVEIFGSMVFHLGAPSKFLEEAITLMFFGFCVPFLYVNFCKSGQTVCQMKTLVLNILDFTIFLPNQHLKSHYNRQNVRKTLEISNR